MGYLGCILFGLVFLFLSPKVRGAITGRLESSTDWIFQAAPFSYIGIGLLLLAPLVAIIVLKTSPKPEEPDNPLARLKREEALHDEF
jgi:hypothetical protein